MSLSEKVIEARLVCVIEGEDGKRYTLDADLTRAEALSVSTGLANDYNLRINADGFGKADAPNWEEVAS